MKINLSLVCVKNLSTSLISIIFFVLTLSVSVLFAAECGGTNCSCNDEVIENAVLTQDLYCNGNALVISRDGVTLDCNGHTVFSQSPVNAVISATNVSGITIKNCFISGLYAPYGIQFFGVRDSVIENTIIFDVENGISILDYLNIYASNIQILDSEIYNVGNGINLLGISHLIKNIRVYNNTGIGIVSYANNSVIENITAYDNNIGITALYSTVKDINSTRNMDGLNLYYSSASNIITSNNTFCGLIATGSTILSINSSGNKDGLCLDSNNSIYNAKSIDNYGYGVYIQNENNTLVNLETKNNVYGVYVHQYGSNSKFVNITTISNSAENFVSKANYTNISYLYSYNGSGGYGIYLDSSYNEISNSVFSNNYIGVYLPQNTGNNVLKNISSINNNVGVMLDASNNNLLLQINASNNFGTGILIQRGMFNTLSNNVMNNNIYNLIVDGYEETQSIDITNTVDGKKVYWLKNAQNQIYDSSSDVGIFACFNCTNITVKDSNLSKNGFGILFKNVTNSLIKNITLSSFDFTNKIYKDLIILNETRNVIIRECKFYDSVAGLQLVIYGGENNLIFNNLFNTSVYDPAVSVDSTNFWNSSYNCSGERNIIGGNCIGGNFWGGEYGHSIFCQDSNNDGICDTPYYISSQNIDFLPITFGGTVSQPPYINLISPGDEQIINSNSVNFTFIATDDDSSILNCSIYLNGLPVSSNNQVLNNTLTTIQVFNLSNSRYEWYISCYDNLNNLGNSETRYFNISIFSSVCSNSICESGENYLNCPSDCQPYCGDSICSYPENCSNCQTDCGICNYTGCPPENPIRCGTQCCPLETTSCNGDSCCVARVDGLCCGNTQYPCYVNGSPWCCNCPPNHLNCFGTCVNILTSNSNCGTCRRVCSSGTTCINGNCVSQIFCGNGICESGESCSSCPQDCGSCPSSECRTGEIRCAGNCINPLTDPSNCGGCGKTCYTGQICSNGTCICPFGLSLCNSQCVNTLYNPSHCGGCGISCPSGICIDGKCIGSCSEGYVLLNGSCIKQAECSIFTIPCGQSCCPISQKCNTETLTCEFSPCKNGLIQCDQYCINPLIDPFNCGSCNNRCPLDSYCSNGQCVKLSTLITCEEGKINCNGFCTDISSDSFNCGGCGITCNIISEQCISGVCVPKTVCGFGQTACGPNCCAPGQACILNTCTPTFCNENQIQCGSLCIDASSDPNNCGRCGFRCNSDQKCTDGKCVPINCGNGICDENEDNILCPQDCKECVYPEELCNGRCVNLQTDKSNCGSCNNKCDLDWNCINGTCKGVLNSRCTSDIDCEFGSCVNGTCRFINCITDSDCRSNEYCNTNLGVCEGGCTISPDNCNEITGLPSSC
ncbi:MAG: NosD domain-containing protein, partial [Candidatus Micrarchaeia archaeon]